MKTSTVLVFLQFHVGSWERLTYFFWSMQQPKGYIMMNSLALCELSNFLVYSMEILVL